MNPAVQQLANLYGNMSLAKKASLVLVVLLALTGFGLMFFMANQETYQTLYTDLNSRDAAAIVSDLKEQNIPYQLVKNGTQILVPAEQVHELRLSLASRDLPQGGGIGFEIFDKSEFGTTKFVQNLNYKRALQGELARTISEFEEVKTARVMVVLPQESVFVEESKPASASVLLELSAQISKEKIAAIENLVASSVENLSANQITIVDTRGSILSKKREDSDFVGASSKLEYKLAFENNLAQRIESMLEGIVGNGKAIVRVTADMDFDRINLQEESYDPAEKAIRSQQTTTRTSRQTGDETGISSVSPIAAEEENTSARSAGLQNSQKEEAVNYEISKTLRHTIQSAGEVTRISVAAVLDGKYETATDEAGNTKRNYVPRGEDELAGFETIVKNAMGYSLDRNDQVSVKSFPFSYMADIQTEPAPPVPYWQKMLDKYGQDAANAALILLVFFFVVIPLLRSIKTIRNTVTSSLSDAQPQLAGGEQEALEGSPEQQQALSAPPEPSPTEKAKQLANTNMDKTASMVRAWANE